MGRGQVSPVSLLSLILCPGVPIERAAVTRWARVALTSVLQPLSGLRARAINGPLGVVIRGLSRVVEVQPICWSECINRTGSANSQADSAGSIPVIRST
jgi:hypothetical protein